MDGESAVARTEKYAVIRLAKAIGESGSYEEFALRCAADREVSNLLEYTAGRPGRPEQPWEIYASMKESFESRPGSRPSGA